MEQIPNQTGGMDPSEPLIEEIEDSFEDAYDEQPHTYLPLHLGGADPSKPQQEIAKAVTQIQDDVINQFSQNVSSIITDYVSTARQSFSITSFFTSGYLSTRVLILASLFTLYVSFLLASSLTSFTLHVLGLHKSPLFLPFALLYTVIILALFTKEMLYYLKQYAQNAISAQAIALEKILKKPEHSYKRKSFITKTARDIQHTVTSALDAITRKAGGIAGAASFFAQNPSVAEDIIRESRLRQHLVLFAGFLAMGARQRACAIVLLATEIGMSKSSMDFIQRHSTRIAEAMSTFGAFTGITQKTQSDPAVIAKANQLVEQPLCDQSAIEDMSDTFNLMSILDEAAETPTGLSGFMEQNSEIVRFVAVMLLWLAHISGLTNTITFGAFGDTVKATKSLADMFRSSTIVYSELAGISDTFLTTAYTMFGATYTTPELKRCAQISAKVGKLYQQCSELRTAMRADALGAMREDSPGKYFNIYTNLLKEVEKLDDTKKNMYQFKQRLDSIYECINICVDARRALLNAAGAKQAPVVVYLSGLPNSGKTFLHNKLMQDVSQRMNGSIYSRTAEDQYWPNYQGQMIVGIDDFGQSKDSTDHSMLFQYTTTNSVDTIGAAIADKGKPFVSQFIFANSNLTWIRKSMTKNNTDALNRRRDYLVYVSNPAHQEYVRDKQIPSADAEFWKENPSQLYLMTSDFRGSEENPVGSITEHPAFIQQITYEQLIEMALAKERLNRAKYIDHIAALASRMPGFTVPPKPVPHDFASTLAPVQRVKYAGSTDIIIPPNVDQTPSVHSEDFILSKFTLHEKALEDRTPIIRADIPGVSPFSNCLQNSFDVLGYSKQFLSTLIEQAEIVNVDLQVHKTKNLNLDLARGVIIRHAIKKLHLTYTLDNSPRKLIKIGEDSQYSESDYDINLMSPGDKIIHLRCNGTGGHFTPHIIIADEPAHNQALVPYPASTAVTHKAFPLVLLGPSGTGKTQALQRSGIPFDLVCEYQFTYQGLPNLGDLHDIVLLDDITLDHSRWEEAKAICHLFHENKLPNVTAIYATGNTTSIFYNSILQNPDELNLFHRRCLVAYLKPTLKTSIATKLRRIPIYKYLEGMSLQERGNAITLITPHGENCRGHVVRWGEALPMHVLPAWLKNMLYERKSLTFEEKFEAHENVFSMPMPTRYELMVSVGFPLNDKERKAIFGDKNGTQILPTILNNLHVVDSHGARINYLSMLVSQKDFLMRMVDGFALAETPEMFVSQFTAQEMPCSRDTSVIVCFSDCVIGFTDINEKLVAFIVDPKAGNWRVTDAGVQTPSQFFPLSEKDRAHHETLLRFADENGKFTRQYRVATEVKITELWTNSVLYKQIRHYASYVSVIMTFAATVGMFWPVAAETGSSAPVLINEAKEHQEKTTIDSSELANLLKQLAEMNIRISNMQERNEKQNWKLNSDEWKEIDRKKTQTRNESSSPPQTTDLDLMLQQLVDLQVRISNMQEQNEKQNWKLNSDEWKEIDRKKTQTRNESSPYYPNTEQRQRQAEYDGPSETKSNTETRFDMEIDPEELQELADARAELAEQRREEQRERDELIEREVAERASKGLRNWGDFDEAELEVGAGTTMWHTHKGFGIAASTAVYYVKPTKSIASGWMVANSDFDGWKPFTLSNRVQELSKPKHGVFKFHPNTIPLDWTVINTLRGKSFKFYGDGNSLFFSTLVFGLPIDFISKTIMPSFLTTIEEITQCRIPKTILDKMASIHCEYRTFMSEPMTNEGTMDPAAVDAYKKIAPNMVEMLDASGKFLCNGIILADLRVLSVEHIAPAVTHVRTSRGVYRVAISNRFNKYDLVTFDIIDTTCTKFNNITRMFITGAQLSQVATTLGNLKGYFVTYECPKKGSPLTLLNSQWVDIKLQREMKAGDDGTYYQSTQGACTNGVSRAGECGNPLILCQRNIPQKLMGMHKKGNDTRSVCAIITQELAMNMMKDEPMIPEAIPLPEGWSTIPNRQIMYSKEKISRGVGQSTIGKVYPAARIPYRTSRYRTGFTAPGVEHYEPAITSPNDPRNPDHKDFLTDQVDKYQAEPLSEDLRVRVKGAFSHIANELIQIFNRMDLQTEVLSTTQAINGDKNGYTALSAIDRNGSAGWPYANMRYGTQKGHFLEFNRKTELWEFAKHEGAIKVASDMNALCAHAKNGTLIECPYVAYPKDECVALRKIYGDKRKTRAFFAGDMAYALGFRKFNQSFYSRLTETFAMHPVKIGISATGGDWEDLFFSLADVSPVGWCADAKDWDARMPAMFMEECAECINTIYEATNPYHQPTDNVARKTLHRNVERAMVILKKEVIRFENGGQISGFPGTAPENSLEHWALSYLVYQDLARKSNLEHYNNYQSYRRYVGSAFYGDDALYSVAHEVQPFFTQKGFIEGAKKYGFTFTPADKNSEASDKFVPLEEMDFLKRSFKRVNGSIVGPLALESLGKHLEWIKDSPAYEPKMIDGKMEFPRSTSEILIKESMHTLWAELALHGPEVYDEWKRHVLQQEKFVRTGMQIPLFSEALKLGGAFL